MKKIKILLGIVVTTVLVASMLLTAALPAGAANIVWGTVTTPQTTYQQLQGNSDVSVLAAAPDGNTLFAYDNGTRLLYKSTTAGVTWSTTNIGTTLEGNHVVAMAVSPAYATDLTVVAASPTIVYRSTNGGASFAEVSTALQQAATGADGQDVVITSISITNYYGTGAQAILIGTRDLDAGGFGGLFLATLDTFTWSDLSVGNNTTGNVYDVLAVAFSPNHAADAQFLAVVADAANTYLTTKFTHSTTAPNNWDTQIARATIGTITDAEIASATIAFADDYEWSSNNRVLVGTSSSDGVLDDVFRVHGTLPPAAASPVFDLNVQGTTVKTNVQSIDVTGTIVGAAVVVGQSGSPSVIRTADPTVSTVTWTPNTKAPTGVGNPDAVLLTATTAGTTTLTVAGAGTIGFRIVNDADGDSYLGPNFITFGDVGDAAIVYPTNALAITAITIGTAGGDTAAGNVLIVCDVDNDATITARTWAAAGAGPSVFTPVDITGNVHTTVIKTATQVFAGTVGDDSALSASSDGGVIFNGLALMDIGSWPADTVTLTATTAGTATITRPATGTVRVTFTTDADNDSTWVAATGVITFGDIGDVATLLPTNAAAVGAIIIGAVGDTSAGGVVITTDLDGDATVSAAAWTGPGATYVTFTPGDLAVTPAFRYQSLSVVDASTMFLLVWDDADGDAAIDLAESQLLFKTTNGGTSWLRVYNNRSTGAGVGTNIVRASPEYATDSTLYLAEVGSARLWKSVNGGNSFTGLAAPANITALTVVSKDVYFTGHAAAIYRSGRWNAGTITGNAISIAVVDENTVFVGNDDGDVYVSTNASATAGVVYTMQGIDDSLGNGASIVVTPHPDYATNKYIFAGTSTASATTGVHRWVVGTSTAWGLVDTGWTDIDADAVQDAGEGQATLIARGVAVSKDGTLYAASGTVAAPANAIRRSLYPTIVTVPTLQSMGTSYPAGAALTQNSLSLVSGTTNVLFGIVTGITTPPSAYPHGYSILTIEDTLAISATLTAPAADAADVAPTSDFTWSAVAAPAGTTVTYTVQYATNSTFAGAVAFAGSPTTGTALRQAGFEPGRKYWWRVIATANTGTANAISTRSASRSFLVRLDLAGQSAAVIAPAPGATNVGITPVFQWAPVAGATGYRIQIADAPTFAAPLANVLLDTNVWLYTAKLDNAKTYYWRVKAIAPETESGWATGAFTTAAAPAPAAPPPVTVTQQPPAPVPTFTVSIPPAPPATTITIPPPPAPVTQQITPAWIFAIIAVGAVLVIAVIVLIIRTRRVT